MPELLPLLEGLRHEREEPDPAYPFVLSAGERRSVTANTALRDPAWRDGASVALRIHPGDATRLGLRDGDTARITTRRGSTTTTVELHGGMREGHVSLPNGLGLDEPSGRAGVALNELTSSDDRDPIAGTPHHKHVRARVEALSG